MAATFAAAYLLVLQSVVGALALGVGPAGAPLDSFGNVICTHEGAELPGDAPQQKHMPACCVLGCVMGSSVLGNPPDAGSLQATLSFESVVYQFLKPERIAFARDRSPANPRAPPVA